MATNGVAFWWNLVWMDPKAPKHNSNASINPLFATCVCSPNSGRTLATIKVRYWHLLLPVRTGDSFYLTRIKHWGKPWCGADNVLPNCIVFWIGILHMYCAKTIVFGRMLMIDCPKLSLQPLPYETVCVDKLSHFVVFWVANWQSATMQITVRFCKPEFALLTARPTWKALNNLGDGSSLVSFEKEGSSKFKASQIQIWRDFWKGNLVSFQTI